MKRFKNILYYADHVTDQTHALQRAVELAKSNRAALTVVDVITESDMQYNLDLNLDIDIKAISAEQRRVELEQFAAPFNNKTISISIQVLVGTSFIELIKSVQLNKYDLLIKKAQGSQSIISRIFGSTDMHLLRKCPCPVWIDGPDSIYPYNNILAAVDPCEGHCQNMNKLILDLSTSLAKKEKAKLNVVHIWRLVGESYLRSPRTSLSNDQVDAILEKNEQKHAHELNKILLDYGMSTDSDGVSLINSEPYKGILVKADEVQADLIVMGTVGRTGLPGFFIGNTAEDVLQNTRCSVLAVKPEGFVSPVTINDK